MGETEEKEKKQNKNKNSTSATESISPSTGNTPFSGFLLPMLEEVLEARVSI